ncbi:rhodanese-related sulfurtransferase [Candidatus Woesearchaeota archaeon]|nr:rhodanese-related sulfurtransferase [Candidatus Woesearchaeota archaeon]
MNYNTISFYRYTLLQNPEELRDTLKQFCAKRNILGRILIATEGINGAVSGTKPHIEELKQYLQSVFPNLTFREQENDKNTYHKLVVKVRKEVCAFDYPIDGRQSAQYVTPQELESMYQNKEDFVIIDARNDYEYEVGRFKNALKMPIKSFREFPKTINDQFSQFKDKKVVMYCTGGIRCEKATAYMKHHGFENVYHVQGGIINYINQVQNDTPSKSHWEGGLFVFDDRLVHHTDSAITHCTHCKKENQQYYNCHNLDCDKLFISCKDCAKTMNKTCSPACKDAPRQRKEKIMETEVGKIENYYAKNNVAFVKLCANLKVGDFIHIKGKTTNTNQTIQEMQNEDGKTISQAHAGQYVTFPISEKVRLNDTISIPQN